MFEGHTDWRLPDAEREAAQEQQRIHIRSVLTLHFFRAYTGVRDLTLRSVYVEGDLVQRVVRSMPLSKLLLDCGFISTDSICVLVDECPNLKAFTCSSYFTGGITDSNVITLAQCGQLEQLCFQGRGLTDSSLIALGQGCPNLRELRLVDHSTTSVTNAGIIAFVTHTPNLECFEATFRVADASSSIVALAQHCPNLHTLILTHVSLRGIEAIDALAQHSSLLKKLSLDHLDPADVAPTQFKKSLLGLLANCTHLERFSVRDGILGTEGRAMEEALRSADSRLTFGITLKVVTQDGNEIFFKLRMATPMQRLMTAFCNRQGVSMNSIRFLFDGSRVSPNQTPHELELEEGDVIDVMVEQQGFLPWTLPPANHAPADDAAARAEAVLQEELPLSALSAADVSALCAHARGPHPRTGRVGVVKQERLLSAPQCAALVDAFREIGCEHTWRLSADDLSSIVGLASYEHLALHFGPSVLAASLRSHTGQAAAAGSAAQFAVRYHAATADGCTPHRISFHRDARRVVVHIPLNEDCEGGRLLVVDPSSSDGGRLVCAERRAGVGVALDNAVVHGVSRVTSGVRYTLLAIFG